MIENEGSFFFASLFNAMIISIVIMVSEGVKEGFYLFLLFLYCFYETLFFVKLEKFPSLLHTYSLSIIYMIVFIHFI